MEDRAFPTVGISQLISEVFRRLCARRMCTASQLNGHELSSASKKLMSVKLL